MSMQSLRELGVFAIVKIKEREEQEYGEYRTRRFILDAWERI
jgi:hypothetical protein